MISKILVRMLSGPQIKLPALRLHFILPANYHLNNNSKAQTHQHVF